MAFCVLATGCLALIIIATSLILMRRPRAAPSAPSGLAPQISATQPARRLDSPGAGRLGFAGHDLVPRLERDAAYGAS